jgi:hypothetical protein
MRKHRRHTAYGFENNSLRFLALRDSRPAGNRWKEYSMQYSRQNCHRPVFFAYPGTLITKATLHA